MTTRWTVAGGSVAVTERGEGPGRPVVCVHSTGLSSRQWRRLIRPLSKTHRVLAPDLIGYGQTPTWPGPGPFETRYDVAIVRACIDAAAPGPVHLVGHSYGGRLVMLAAAERPERVASISCFEPVSFGVLHSTGDREGIDELLAYNHDGLFLDEDFGGTIAWIERFVDYWNGKGAFARMSDRERDTYCASGRKMFEEVRETSQDQVPHSHYEALSCPALFISGSRSTRAGQRTARVLAKVLPHGRHVEIDAGHMGPLSASSEVNTLITEHIAAVEAQA